MGHRAIMPDYLITCPLDESHRILKSRMQFHLVRCLKNHKLDGKKLKCPWNPLHIIDQFAWEDHWTNKCEDLPNVMGSTLSIKADEIHRDVGSIPLGAVNDALPPQTNEWDTEPYSGTYDATKQAESMPVLRICVGLSKAKKKAWRQAERKRHQELEKMLPIQMKSTSKTIENTFDSLPMQRRPHSVATAMSTDVSMIEDLDESRNSQDIELNLQLSTSVRSSQAPSEKESAPLFDVCYGYDESKYDGMRKNSHSRINHNGYDSDARSVVSTTSSKSSKVEVLLKLMEQTPVTTKSFASVASSSSSQEKILKNEPPMNQTNPFQDEAASRPIAVEPQNKATTDDVDIDQLRQLLDNLTTLDSQSFEAQKATLIAKISQLKPKLNNSSAHVEENRDHPKVKQPNNSQADGFSKCAANFPKLKKPQNSTSVTEDQITTDI